MTTRPTIAFDTWAMSAHVRNQGIHVYASNLLARFREMAAQYDLAITPYTCTGADNDANQVPPATNFSPKPTKLLKFDRLWRFGGACALASMQHIDLVFSPHCTPLYAGGLAPAAVTLHDLTPVFMPWQSRRVTAILRFCSRWSAKFSRAIITVSQRSKMDILNVYGVPESKVSVIYNGYDRSIFNSATPDPAIRDALSKRFCLGRPYLFHHGAIKPNKNLKRLIQAFRLLTGRNKNLDFDLVLAGPLGLEHEDVLATANEEAGAARGKVVFTGPLAAEELATLIKGASLVVIPSLYEGFCLPLVESMACGTPTIAANSSCLPEISGGILRYFDPESVEEMAARMVEALENGDLRQELSRKGLARANDFDWDRCARETLTLLGDVARDRRNR